MTTKMDIIFSSIYFLQASAGSKRSESLHGEETFTVGIQKKSRSGSSSLPPSLSPTGHSSSVKGDTRCFTCVVVLLCIDINCSDMGKSKNNKTNVSRKQADKAGKHSR